MEKGLKLQYAPKVSEGVVLNEADASALSTDDAVSKATDIEQPEQFIAAGFDVNFVGPEGEVLARGAEGADVPGAALRRLGSGSCPYIDS